jgi:hypothetical protein
MRRGTDGKKESGNQPPVKTFQDAIVLGMECSGDDVGDV